MIRFKLEGDFVHLIQVLKATNLVLSGGEAQIAVADGHVAVNGEIDYRKRRKVKRGDTVEFRDKKIIVE